MDSTKKSEVQIVFAYEGYEPPTRRIYVDEKSPLLEQLIANNIQIDHSCGGSGTCGTCHYFVQEGFAHLSKPDETEKELITERKFESNERLSCQSYVFGNVKILIK